jgi:hypothetical protein
MKNNKFRKFKSELCDNNMTFDECELAILRHAVDETESIKGRKAVNSEDVKNMLKIVEEFIIRKKLICYGGTAINNILPKYAQFYNRDMEIPDYDFYSSNALEDAKELADIYYKAGYGDVEAKSGVHMGTFKVFVNFIPIADITQMHKALFNSLLKESISIAGVHYAPPNFLRMAVYLELSRPNGDVSRWEKVFKRLNLLNKYYPISTENKCRTVDFVRKADKDSDDLENLYISVRDSFIDQGVVFFGGYATTLYSKHVSEDQKNIFAKYPDFDVLSEEPAKCATILKEHLMRLKFKNIKLINHEAIGEIVPKSIEVRVGKKVIAFIYAPIACHSYNTIHVGDKQINVASIDTILSFYLSFIYVDMDYYDRDRLLCMSTFLFNIEEKNRLEQKGMLKRFSLNCIGKQKTLEDMRSEKADKYKELSNQRDSIEYAMWFLKYNPDKKEEKVEKVVEKVEKGEKVVEKVVNSRKTQKEASFIEKYIRNQKTRRNKKSSFF